MSANDDFSHTPSLFRSSFQGVSARICVYMLVSLVMLTGLFRQAAALPQFAYMERSRCIQCHINAQGGGLRNSRGWNFMRDTALIPPENIGLDKLYALNSTSNSFFDRRLTLGFDERYQVARSHRSEDADREYFNMQTEVHADFRLLDWLHAEGAYNAADNGFDGQSEWTASVIYQPEYSYRQVRAGRFRPAIGLRYDDHTMLVSNVPGAFGTVLVPPGYAEYGVQYTENSPDWLSVTIGVFDADNLAESFVTDPDGNLQPLVDDGDNLSWLARAEFRPGWGGSRFGLVPGVSYFANDDFDMLNLFAGAGIGERLSVIADYARSEKDGMRITHNIMLEGSYRIIPPVMLVLRGERGRTYTDIAGGDEVETYTNQGLVGAQLFVLPSIEIRPEYRIVDTERYRSTRWALQVHVFR